MRSMKQLRQRISSVKGTRQMTATMKVVALARLKKKHAKLLQTTPYLVEMDRIVRRLIRAVSVRQEQEDTSLLPSLLTGSGCDEKYMVAVITSDTGLNGGAIWSVLQKTQELVDYLLNQKKQVQLISFGTHGAAFLKRAFPNLAVHVIPRKSVDKEQGYLSATRLATDLIEAFQRKKTDTCLCVYNHFENMAIQHPTIRQLIPNQSFENENPWHFLARPDDLYRRRNSSGKSRFSSKEAAFYKAVGQKKLAGPWGRLNTEILTATTRRPEAYDYEPNEKMLLEKMLPIYLTAYVHTILLDSAVCDEAARLIAMDNATHNADEMLSDLAREYRHLRQDRITNQTIQLMSGVMSGG